MINALVVALPPLVNTAPATFKFPPLMLPVAVIKPLVPMLPILALPVTDRLINAPKLVTLGCALVVNGPVNAPATTVPEFANTLATVKLPDKFKLLPDIVRLAEPSINPPLLNCIDVFDPAAYATPVFTTAVVAVPVFDVAVR